MRKKRSPLSLIVSFREPADLMREYFRNARIIYNEARRALDLNERSESSLVTQFRDWRSRLSNSEFTVSNERIYLRSPAQLTNDPAIILRLLEFVARHGIPLAAETERRVEQACETFAAYCERAQPLWPPLHAILSLPHAAAALRVMHDTGLLQAMFPEWRTIFCLVVPDFYHRYTVDEHTLVTIEKLAELAASKDPARAPPGRNSLRSARIWPCSALRCCFTTPAKAPAAAITRACPSSWRARRCSAFKCAPKNRARSNF